LIAKPRPLQFKPTASVHTTSVREEGVMSERRCYRFAYLRPAHKGREQPPFQLRDGDAALYLIDALGARGYRYGGPIINYPSAGPTIVPFDDGFFHPDDVILMTTRPPMNDVDFGDKKSILRSYTRLEEKLFTGPLGVYLRWCGRSEVMLTSAAAEISPEIAKRQSLVFRQNGGAMYQSYSSPSTGQSRRFTGRETLTAVFLLYAEHAWPGGPALLAAFAMGGTETLVWCYQLATRYPHLLCTKPFVMAEMRTGTLPERPASMAFADSWEITIFGTAEPAAPPAPPAHGPKRAA
jgi:hypothetical protein